MRSGNSPPEASRRKQLPSLTLSGSTAFAQSCAHKLQLHANPATTRLPSPDTPAYHAQYRTAIALFPSPSYSRSFNASSFRLDEGLQRRQTPRPSVRHAVAAEPGTTANPCASSVASESSSGTHEFPALRQHLQHARRQVVRSTQRRVNATVQRPLLAGVFRSPCATGRPLPPVVFL